MADAAAGTGGDEAAGAGGAGAAAGVATAAVEGATSYASLPPTSNPAVMALRAVPRVATAGEAPAHAVWPSLPAADALPPSAGGAGDTTAAAPAAAPATGIEGVVPAAATAATAGAGAVSAGACGGGKSDDDDDGPVAWAGATLGGVVIGAVAKRSWPEAIGMDVDAAVALIEAERPDLLLVQPTREGAIVALDVVAARRVRVWYDVGSRRVTREPTIG